MATIGPLSLAPLRFSISVKDASSLAKAVSVLLQPVKKGRPISLIFGLHRHRVRAAPKATN